jgi:hypothetical protein
MPHSSIVNISQMFTAATVLSAAGFLVSPTPAQASPKFPLAPACNQFGFAGSFSLRQDNGYGVGFSARGTTVAGPAGADGDSGDKLVGRVTGGIKGRQIDFTIRWNGGASGHYTGDIADDGSVLRGVTIDQSNANSEFWTANYPLRCMDAPPAPPVVPPPPPGNPEVPAPAGPAAARLGVTASGPTTLRAGQGAAYTVILSNPGDAGAPVELYISFGGQLQQTGQVTPSGGVNCDVINNAGGTTAVHCTTQQLPSKATASIVVQGRGAAPGAGHLTATINSSDPAAQFVQKSQKLDVSIT